ncbi:MAG: AMP-binding protein [Bacteroidia bacterium]
MTSYHSLYNESIQNPNEFWSKQAAKIKWFKEPSQIVSQDEKGHYRWFADGQLNTSYLAIDAHIEAGRGFETALIYESPVTNTVKKYTYYQLLEEVEKLAGGLKKLGVTKGDRVLVYLPMIPQALFSMLACARIGAVHSVVFGGFAAHELALRIDDAKPKVVITTNFGIEVTRTIEYKPIIDKGIAESSFKPEHVIIFNRGDNVPFTFHRRDVDYTTLTSAAKPASYVPVQATDPLYILYTSGTTGKPKGIIRDNGGHAVALKFSMDHIYNCKAGETFWAASDVGWVVGHSYIVYAPLIQGCATVLFEGKPIKTPDASTFWRVIQDHQVKVMFTAPTAIRAIKKEDPEGKHIGAHDISSLKYQFLAGERCDVTTLNWLEDMLHIPVIDHWWQTESGWPMLANMAGVELLNVKPGSATKPVCGYDLRVLAENGTPCAPGEEGYVVAKLPLPPGCLPSLYNDDERFEAGYLNKFPGYYFTGDGGFVDEDGYFFITGRVDDIINVAGHRLSTAEMEEVVAAHSAVAECAVIGINCPLKGQQPLGVVVIKEGVTTPKHTLEAELIADVRAQIGAVASLKHVLVAQRLPKTRSGKILRKTMRALADNKPFNFPSTIDDPSIVDEIDELFKSQQIGAYEAVKA